MIKSLQYRSDKTFVTRRTGGQIEVPSVLSTAWENDGNRAQIFVNHTDSDAAVLFRGETFVIPPRSGILKNI